jgi:hypothetical protein
VYAVLVVALLLANCTGSSATATTTTATTTSAQATRIFRQLAIDRVTANAHRTTFILTLDRDDVTLVEQEDTTEGVRTLADIDHAAWMRRSNRTYHGTQRDTALELRTEGMQPLSLNCADRRILAAPLDAGCETTRSIAIQALTCVARDQDMDASDGDDRLVFASPIGVDWLSGGNDCFRDGGLRFSK